MKVLASIALALLCALSFGQKWSEAYSLGLESARRGDWVTARASFEAAHRDRPGDVGKPTRLPGPPTERRQWRDGAAYSPVFLAAYSNYQAALTVSDEAQRQELLRIARVELESLIKIGQANRATVMVLDAVLTQAKALDRVAVISAVPNSITGSSFLVDTEIVDPSLLAVQSNQSAPVIMAGSENAANPGRPTTPGTPVAPTVSPNLVAVVPSKFALVIGNSIGSDPAQNLPFAANDAERVRDTLTGAAGYGSSNVVTLQNATVAEIRAAADELAARLPEDATVLVYFSGGATNLDGRDYLAGTDTADLSRAGGMIAKSDLFRIFMARGARIFAFFQVNRTLNGNRFFGSEPMTTGALAQMQSTLPGATSGSVVRGQRVTGLFTEAFTAVLSDFRTNQVPINEFGWEVFYRMRRMGGGSVGGGSPQTSTLPVLVNLGSDARF